MRVPEPGQSGLAPVDVSRETSRRLAIYAELLKRWQQRINLVADSTLNAVETRHFADSMQLRRLAPDALCWIDLGSGAGFPGMVVAIDLADNMTADIHLIESNGKKCAFLREVARETGAKVQIHHTRIEDVIGTIAATRIPDIISARALAPLSTLLRYTYGVLKTPTRALFMKGQDVDAELTDSAKCWSLTHRLHRSAVDERGWVVEVLQAEPRDLAVAHEN